MSKRNPQPQKLENLDPAVTADAAAEPAKSPALLAFMVFGLPLLLILVVAALKRLLA
jgi:hypothetical protein